MENKFFGSTNLDNWGIFRGDYELPSQFMISAYVTGDPYDWRGEDVLEFITAQKNSPDSRLTYGYDDDGDDITTGVTTQTQSNLASAIAFMAIERLYAIKTGGIVTPYDMDMLYETGARVSINNIEYLSLQDDNKNHNPESNPTYWRNVDNAIGGYFKNPISYTVNSDNIVFTSGNYLFDDGTGWATLPAMTKTQSTWSAGDNGGIKASGSFANDTAYTLNLIYNSTTAESDVIIGNAPSGWSVVAYLGTVHTQYSSTDFFAGRQDNNRFTYSVPIDNGVQTSSGGAADFIMVVLPMAPDNSIMNVATFVQGQTNNVSSWDVTHASTVYNNYSTLIDSQKVATEYFDNIGMRAKVNQTSHFSIQNDGQQLFVNSSILNGNIVRDVVIWTDSYVDLNIVCY